MKTLKLKYALLTLSLVIAGTLFSQNAGAVTPGIYKSIAEYKEGIPSLPLQNNIKDVHVHLGVWATSPDYVSFARIKMNRREARRLGKVFAFSDGQNLYLKTNKLKTRKISNFAQAEPINKFLYYKDVITVTTDAKHGVWVNLPVQKLLNTETGKRIYLNRHTLKRIIAGNHQLWRSFKHESCKREKLKEYLIRFYNS